MTTIIVGLRALSLIGGLVMCYAALFLYEDEEREVQNTLEAWWLRIENVKRIAIEKHVSFARHAAQLAQLWLDRLFGAKLISWRVLAISGCLSLASLQVITGVDDADRAMSSGIALAETPVAIRERPFSLAVIYPLTAARMSLAIVITYSGIASYLRAAGLIAVICVILQLRWRKLWKLCLAVLMSTVLVLLMAHFIGWPAYVTAPTSFALALLLGFACDVAAVAAIRRTIRWQASRTGMTPIALIACVQLALATAIVQVPIRSGLATVLWGWSDIGHGLIVSAATNILASCLCLSFFVSAATLLLHRATWPMISRPLYQIARLGLFKSVATRTALFALGLTLAGIGSGTVDTIWPQLLRLVVGSA